MRNKKNRAVVLSAGASSFSDNTAASNIKIQTKDRSQNIFERRYNGQYEGTKHRLQQLLDIWKSPIL